MLPNNRQIWFCSWRIYPKKPMKWCYLCYSRSRLIYLLCFLFVYFFAIFEASFLLEFVTDFPDLKKFDWYLIGMTLRSLNLKTKYKLVKLKLRLMVSKSHQHMQWKYLLLKNNLCFSKLAFFLKCACKIVFKTFFLLKSNIWNVF